MNRSLTPGRLRRLQTAAGPEGVFRILALDHRRVLLNLMDPDGGGRVPAGRITELKLDLVRRLGPLATAVILDPQYSALQAIASGALPGSVGLIVPLDNGLREGGSFPREGRTTGWTVQQARQVGACGVKLYITYRPDAGARTEAQEELVREVVRQCADAAMPFFLEAVLPAIDPDSSIGEVRPDDLRQITIRTAERLGVLGPDVLKLPFPVDCRREPNEAIWRSACAELSDASPVPWALLSAGVPFDRFKVQLQVACETGCSGFMAGRSVWSEAATAEGGARAALIEGTILPRLRELNQIADRYGHGLREKCALALEESGPD